MPQFLVHMENNVLFWDGIECQKLLVEVMKCHLLPERWPMLQSPWTKPRKSTVGTPFAIAGMYSTKGATNIEKHDLYKSVDSCGKYQWDEAAVQCCSVR